MSTVGEGMAQRRDKADPEGLMTFGDHLDELRRRLLLAILPPLPLAILLFFFAEPIRNLLCRPLIKALVANGLPPQLQALSPIETVVLDLKLAVILAVVFSAPWLLWQAWCFIAPGLYRHERRFVVFLIPGSAVLTVTGVALLHLVMLPLVLTMLVSFGTGQGAFPLPTPKAASDVARIPGLTLPILDEHPAQVVVGESYLKRPENLLCVVVESGDGPELLTVPLGRNPMVAQQYRLTEYVSFVLVMTAGMALAFQMPLVILLLGWTDLVRIETLRKNRKWALFILAIVAAVITPPDLVSMLVTWVPLYALYELGVLMLHFLPPSVIAGTSGAGTVSTAATGATASGAAPSVRAPDTERPVDSGSLPPPKPRPALGTVSRQDDLFPDSTADSDSDSDSTSDTPDTPPSHGGDGARDWTDGNEDDEDEPVAPGNDGGERDGGEPDVADRDGPTDDDGEPDDRPRGDVR